MRRAFVAPALLAAAALALCSLPDADAQRFDPRRPAVFVVGSPGGAAPMVRVDARRSGLTKDTLPGSGLRIAWRKNAVATIDQPVLAGPEGTLALVTLRGDVVFFDRDGDERGRVNTSAGTAGPATTTSDGTVVFANRTGEVFGVKPTLTRPRFQTRIGGGDLNLRAAPLALDDGGVVFATLGDLVVLDSEGGIRTRIAIPEQPAAPLLTNGQTILAVALSGAVYGWTPGREVVRLGSFGAAIDGSAALVGANTMLAVIEGNHVVELDIARGTRTTRAIAPQGLYLGPPAVRGSLATILAMTPTRAFVVNLDGSGQETLRAPIAQLTPAPLADGGLPALVAPPHSGALVDARGAVAFAAPDGRVGAVSPEGAVEILPDKPCAPTIGRGTGVVGVTPFGRGAFVVTCEANTVVKVVGPDAEPPLSGPKPPRPRSSSIAPPERPPEKPPQDLDEDED